MDGHHGDRRFGRIAAAAVLLRHLALLLQAQVSQPVGGGHRAQALAMHLLLQQLGRLLQIGQGAAAQGQPGQALAGQQLSEDRGQPLLRQSFRQAGDPLCQPIPGLGRGAADPLGAPPEQGGGGQQPQAARITRGAEGIEQPLQGQGSLTGEHIPLAHQPAGQAAALQGDPQGLRLLVGADQQAEVARLQQPVAGPLAESQMALEQALAERRHLLLQLVGLQLQQLQ